MIVSKRLGAAYRGSLSAQLNAQLQKWEQMCQIPTHLNPQCIEYIDLKNLKVLAVHLKIVISKESATLLHNSGFHAE